MSFPPSFFDHLEDRLNLAVYDINQEYRMGEVPPIVYWHKPPIDESMHETPVPTVNIIEQIEQHMSAIDRIKAKALQARNIAPDALKKFEADLDGLIAQESEIEAKRVSAVSPHQEAIAGVKGELDGLKSAIDILSNDG